MLPEGPSPPHQPQPRNDCHDFSAAPLCSVLRKGDSGRGTGLSILDSKPRIAPVVTSWELHGLRHGGKGRPLPRCRLSPAPTSPLPQPSRLTSLGPLDASASHCCPRLARPPSFLPRCTTLPSKRIRGTGFLPLHEQCRALVRDAGLESHPVRSGNFLSLGSLPRRWGRSESG